MATHERILVQTCPGHPAAQFKRKADWFRVPHAAFHIASPPAPHSSFFLQPLT